MLRPSMLISPSMRQPSTRSFIRLQQGRFTATRGADKGGYALLRNVQADVEQGLLVAVVEAQARHLQADFFLGQAQALLVAAEAGDVDSVGRCFVLHNITPFVAETGE